MVVSGLLPPRRRAAMMPVKNAGADHGHGPGEGWVAPVGPGDGDVVGEPPQQEGPAPAFGGLAALGNHGLNEVEALVQFLTV